MHDPVSSHILTVLMVSATPMRVKMDNIIRVNGAAGMADGRIFAVRMWGENHPEPCWPSGSSDPHNVITVIIGTTRQKPRCLVFQYQA